MEPQTVTHSTFVIERNYPASPERVFSAFAEPSKKRRWFAEGDGFELQNFEMDFRVGGAERTRFLITSESPVKGSIITNETIYQDIVLNRRIVIAYTMTIGDHRMSASQSTFELVAAAKGTTLLYTEQAAFFEGSDGAQMREQGWNSLLDTLGKELAN